MSASADPRTTRPSPAQSQWQGQATCTQAPSRQKAPTAKRPIGSKDIFETLLTIFAQLKAVPQICQFSPFETGCHFGTVIYASIPLLAMHCDDTTPALDALAGRGAAAPLLPLSEDLAQSVTPLHSLAGAFPERPWAKGCVLLSAGV